MAEIKEVGVLSCGKLFGVLYAIIGFIFGIVVALVSLVGNAYASSSSGMFGMLFGVGAMIIFPVFYGVLGFIFASLMAVAYNFVASLIGGIEVEIGGIEARTE